MVAKNQNIIDTHTKRMESKYNTKHIHQLQGERVKEEMNKKEIQKQLDNN